MSKNHVAEKWQEHRDKGDFVGLERLAFDDLYAEVLQLQAYVDGTFGHCATCRWGQPDSTYPLLRTSCSLYLYIKEAYGFCDEWKPKGAD